MWVVKNVTSLFNLFCGNFTRQVARFFVAQFIVPLVTCVLLLYDEGPRELQNLFAITRSRYVEVLFHIFYYCWVKNIVYFTEDFVTSRSHCSFL